MASLYSCSPCFSGEIFARDATHPLAELNFNNIPQSPAWQKGTLKERSSAVVLRNQEFDTDRNVLAQGIKEVNSSLHERVFMAQKKQKMTGR